MFFFLAYNLYNKNLFFASAKMISLGYELKEHSKTFGGKKVFLESMIQFGIKE